MIDFNIDIAQKSPHLDLLESLKQQSHALNTIHNPKTWCLSALTYALHLNDCLVLFEDLKNRWQQELPFAEAWDVDFRLWKTEIWSAANNIQSKASAEWKSLCDSDFAKFIELSNKVAEGEITIAPLMEFVEGKETSIGNIIVDAGRQLSSLFSDIEKSINYSCSELYQTFYDSCIESYRERNKETLYNIYTKTETQTYEAWVASKSPKKLRAAIEKLKENIVKEMREYKTLSELWNENYDEESKEIDTEGIARYIFINRTSLISSKQPTYQQSFDKLFYTVFMLEFLDERLEELGSSDEKPLTPDEIEANLRKSNDIFKPQIEGHDVCFTKLRKFLIDYAVSGISYKNEWYGIYLFAFTNNLLQESSLKNFEEQMNKPEWFGYLADRKKCSADSMGDYHFMIGLNENKWYENNIIPNASKATGTGLNRVLKKYGILKVEYKKEIVLL